MTYLLLCAGIAAKNALALDQVEFYKILVTDGALLGVLVLMELVIFKKSINACS